MLRIFFKHALFGLLIILLNPNIVLAHGGEAGAIGFLAELILFIVTTIFLIFWQERWLARLIIFLVLTISVIVLWYWSLESVFHPMRNPFFEGIIYGTLIIPPCILTYIIIRLIRHWYTKKGIRMGVGS
jgi:hypothetical protein